MRHTDLAGHLLVAAGGALGALLRWGASLLFMAMSSPAWPWGTLVVNMVGAAAMGATHAMWPAEQRHRRLFWHTGVFGGFTTFSLFSLECMMLLQQGESYAAGSYFAFSLILWVIAVRTGVSIGRCLKQPVRNN